MKNLSAALLLFGTIAIISGCAVIDFLDGKQFDHPPDHDRPQYSGGSTSGGDGGGHHH